MRRAVKELEVLHNFINNEFVPSHSAATFDLSAKIHNPVAHIASKIRVFAAVISCVVLGSTGVAYKGLQL